MKDFHNQNYYELLEITPEATQEEVLKAYQRARNTYGSTSPALYSVFNKQEAQELLKLIDEAYTVLSNQFKRKKYDLSFDKKSESFVESNASSSGMVAQKNPGTELTEDLLEGTLPLAAASSSESMEDLLQNLTKGAPGPNKRVPSIGDKKPTPIPVRPGNSANFIPVAQASSKSAEKKPGMTRFGSYDIDEKFETEINELTEFDGGVLLKIRTYKNVSVDQMCESIRIGRVYLKALESNDFSSLPAPVFVRGFLNEYARVLNLNTDTVAKSYLQNLKQFKK